MVQFREKLQTSFLSSIDVNIQQQFSFFSFSANTCQIPHLIYHPHRILLYSQCIQFFIIAPWHYSFATCEHIFYIDIDPDKDILFSLHTWKTNESVFIDHFDEDYFREKNPMFSIDKQIENLFSDQWQLFLDFQDVITYQSD